METKININKIIKEIASRIKAGDYNGFSATKNRLEEIAKKLITGKKLSSNDVITLKLNGYTK